MEKLVRTTFMKAGLVSVLLLLFSLISINAGVTGEPGSTLQKAPEGSQAGDGIKTGYVIYFGQPLSPPYKFTMESGEIFINGLPTVPKKPESESTKIVVPESTRREHELIQAICKNYGDWVEASNIEEAKSRLNDFLKDQPLINRYEWKGETLVITFPDGDSEHILLHNVRMKREIKKHFSQSEIDEIQLNKRTKRFKGYQDHLKEGGIMAFGKSYIAHIPIRYTKEYIPFIKNTLSSPLSDDEKSKILHEKFSQVLVDDLIKNQMYW